MFVLSSSSPKRLSHGHLAAYVSLKRIQDFLNMASQNANDAQTTYITNSTV
jgi:hypothetical protein